jgi:hypothetical protein
MILESATFLAESFISVGLLDPLFIGILVHGSIVICIVVITGVISGLVGAVVNNHWYMASKILAVGVLVISVFIVLAVGGAEMSISYNKLTNHCVETTNVIEEVPVIISTCKTRDNPDGEWSEYKMTTITIAE